MGQRPFFKSTTRAFPVAIIRGYGVLGLISIAFQAGLALLHGRYGAVSSALFLLGGCQS